jgi:flagellar biosynthesis/type III secretory pathway chaperone
MSKITQFGSWIRGAHSAVAELITDLSELLSILDQEESLIVEHDITQYEILVRRKESVGEKIASNYNLLFKAMGHLIDWSRLEQINVEGGETLSSTRRLAFQYWASVRGEVNSLESKVIDHTLSLFSKEVESVLALQTEVKPRVEHNAMLMGKLIESHRESYLFWRDLLARESSGYNSHGQKKKSHSLSYFVTKA